jgi:uncharacterized protein
VRRVVTTARTLAVAEGAPLEVVIPAAWLHDCVHVPKQSPDRARASRMAAEEATRLLRAWHYPDALVDQVAHAIEAHSFTAGIEPRTPAARVVQDADRLDALGAIGLARCLMLGATMGRPLYDAADPFCQSRAPDDARASLDHLWTKLFTLEHTMQTAAGRQEARRRTAFLRAFVQQLQGELGATVPTAVGHPPTPASAFPTPAADIPPHASGES